MPGADGRGGLRGGQRGGRALGVAPPAAAAMAPRGRKYTGRPGAKRCARDLMMGLVRTRQFAGRHGQGAPGWGSMGEHGGRCPRVGGA
jgi:hypothetical protein